MYRVIGQNVSVQHVQEDTGDESAHITKCHVIEIPYFFLQGLFKSKGFML